MLSSMSILDRLASSQNRRDEVPNQELAATLVAAGDETSIAELVRNLAHKDKAIQSDCIKVLYEIAEVKPHLVARFHRDFARLLESKNSRMVWGAMTALDAIVVMEPAGVAAAMSQILKAAQGDSVIARDHAVGILAKLATLPAYSARCLPELLNQLRSSPANQFPMYCELAAPAVAAGSRTAFLEIITNRLPGLTKDSQRKRVQTLVTSIKI